LVDTNLFPQALVSRVEVVTGGASAAYGSDAVSGVVNFILDKEYEGVKGELQYGLSDRGDGPEQKYTISAGRSVLGGRAHLLGSFEYFRAQEIPERLSREIAQRSCQVISLPAGSPTLRDYQCNVRVANANFNGLITGPAAFQGTTFDAAGNPIPFNFGTLRTGATMVGGDGVIPQFAPLSAGIDKKIAFARASYDINDDTTAFVELNYGEIGIGYQVGSFSNVLGNTALQIRRDNAFLPPSIRDRMVALNAQTITVGKYLNELPKSQVTTFDQTTRGVAGLNGVLAGWDWGGYVELAENRRKLLIGNDLILPNYVRATDAIVGSNGAIVCRSNVGASPGCIPVNPFGTPNLTPEQRRYIVGTNYNLTHSYEYVAAFNVSNEPFSTWAGPVSIAAGAEYRKLGFDQVVDPGSIAPNFVTNGTGVYRVGNARPQEGEYDVREAFLETVVPLASGMRFADELELNAAARITEYSTSGTVTTWKVGATYQPFEGLRFRGTRSRDIRAPTLNELFQAGVTNFIPSIFDTVRKVQVTNARSITLGNLDLAPEIANTTTFGVVYSPTFAPRLDLSLDYYEISIDDAISTPGAGFVLEECARGVQSLCDRLFRDAAGNLLTVELVPLNLQSFQTEGFDLEASYRLSLDELMPAIGGELSLRAIANHTSKFISRTSGAVTAQDQAGESGNRAEVARGGAGQLRARPAGPLPPGTPHGLGGAGQVHRADGPAATGDLWPDPLERADQLHGPRRGRGMGGLRERQQPLRHAAAGPCPNRGAVRSGRPLLSGGRALHLLTGGAAARPTGASGRRAWSASKATMGPSGGLSLSLRHAA
jgi:outer membrane receptor protein involved in Fe transport